MKREEINIKLTNEQRALANVLDREFEIEFDIEDGVITAEMSGYTNGGVNEIVYLNPFTLDEFEKYVNNFDIDDEIDIYRQDASYRDAFRISDSVRDFEEWVGTIEDLVDRAEKVIYAMDNPNDNDECFECCPHCEEEVALPFEFKVHTCPNCGKRIVPCSICPLKNCVKPCPLEKQAQIENGEKDYDDED